MTKPAADPPKKPQGPEPERKPLDPMEFSRKIVELMEQAQPAITEIIKRMQSLSPPPITEAPIDPLAVQQASAELWGHYMRHPSRLVEMQLKYAEDMSNLWQESARKFMGEGPQTICTGPPSGDRRFRDPVWHENPGFDFLRQSYLMTRDWIQGALNDAHELSEDDRRKLEFYTRQFLDALAPNNFALTNPEVIRETLRTGGDNLIKGMQNLIEDMKRGQGELKISTTKYSTFKLGHNLAPTPGKVVFRNRLVELIQYTPTTRTVHEIPMLIISPWINKYYILDLTSEKSLVKFALDQGFSVFMVSWINPDQNYADILFDDYMRDGLLAALDVVEDVTKSKTTNVVGYCIGGTLTAMTLAWLKRKKQGARIHSATFLTTLLDFEKSGDMKVFIDEKQLDELETHMKRQGFLEAAALQKTFSILRANDMIWSFVINNYMMGREPFPFDILYWNEDSTNLPAAFHSYYLRHMYLRNDLIKPDKLTINGAKIDLSLIDVPLYFLSTREDHIAPWKATFDGARRLAHANKHVRFTLAASGHVAGVVNPPASGKYGYWTNKKIAGSADHWLHDATYTDGSWWNDWAKWIKTRAGTKKTAPKVQGNAKYKPLCDAPGIYVLNEKFKD